MPGSPVRRLLGMAACGCLLGGCEVRDEEARTGPPAAWYETIARRLDSGAAEPRVRTPTAGGVECIDGFAAGARRAREGGLPMLLVFRAAWCRWSGDLVESVLGDERMASAAGRVVCVSVDADREPAICRSFGVQTFPTVLVLDTDRRERFRATGAAARRGLPAAIEAACAPADSPRVADLPGTSPR
ncbi:MAG: thioredoxin family protein [Planctomycetota bacterium]